MIVAVARPTKSPTMEHRTTIFTVRSVSARSTGVMLVAHAEGSLSPAAAQRAPFFDMADIKPKPQLIVSSHPDELNSRLAIFDPSHNPKVHAHGAVLVEVDT
jgi:hypothetical protein